MVGDPGKGSNSDSSLLAAWNSINKGELLAPEEVFTPEIEELFKTLAEWNEYLENHVPSFKEPQP